MGESQEEIFYHLKSQNTHENVQKPTEYKWQLVWGNVIMIPILHVAALYGCYIYLTKIMWTSLLFHTVVYARLGGLGITAGAHRLWAHRSYKARMPLQILLVILNCIAFEGSVINWVRDHRMHHRYSETDADPHNAKRGFFFAHVGWLMLRKHPDIKAKAHTIDMSDILNDPLLRFQKKYYLLLALIFTVIVPLYVTSFWDDSLYNNFFVGIILRYVTLLNYTWLVNSAAHLWGSRPYDKNINPAENRLVSFFAMGEGFHNYHHTYPWDYKAAELGDYSLNVTKLFIDGMAKIGWAYDLKTVPEEVVKERVRRTGG